ncbi:hypothetical protein SBA1_1430007 [Candidatus Sulfotelmatobacter kueseliae]|uniref:Uncharacterized protein n=1 Tax=Candidatus Sulfotelmatobacter kueseliae TaxID=2042962 RepID=A0A2U3K811_9BACT|nr:hypothetical protein SBA1_1430007 [Candidatus Sulfotelmatobacter kueseliae]
MHRLHRSFAANNAAQDDNEHDPISLRGAEPEFTSLAL